MAVIKSFRDLEVYQRSLREAKRIYLLSKRFPQDERFALTDQIRRASRAVSALLAEAWARRRYQAAFKNKVNEALAEAMETQSWLDHARMCEYISQDEYEDHDQAWQHIGGKLQRMIQRAGRFCEPAS